jgi:hypothetical protein
VDWDLGSTGADDADRVDDLEMPEQIACVDCGGTAHRISYLPPEGWEPGDTVAYRCADCRDRWDLVVPGGDED